MENKYAVSQTLQEIGIIATKIESYGLKITDVSMRFNVQCVYCGKIFTNLTFEQSDVIVSHVSQHYKENKNAHL